MCLYKYDACVIIEYNDNTNNLFFFFFYLSFTKIDHAIVELYENAANIQPKNEEFGNHWFMAMVRNNDYKGQQAAALKLHRTFKQNKYLFWAIMSLALQVR